MLEKSTLSSVAVKFPEIETFLAKFSEIMKFPGNMHPLLLITHESSYTGFGSTYVSWHYFTTLHAICKIICLHHKMFAFPFYTDSFEAPVGLFPFWIVSERYQHLTSTKGRIQTKKREVSNLCAHLTAKLDRNTRLVQFGCQKQTKYSQQ